MHLAELADAALIAFLPVFSAIAVLVVKKYGNRIEGKVEDAKEIGTENKELSKELKRKLTEAEALIRGDIKNGVKTRLDSIDEKLPKA